MEMQIVLLYRVKKVKLGLFVISQLIKGMQLNRLVIGRRTFNFFNKNVKEN
jgi:hypothetical protein